MSPSSGHQVLHDLAATLRWYARGVVGADAYERYLEHQFRRHPGHPVLGKREFWREKYHQQEVSPGTRCC